MKKEKNIVLISSKNCSCCLGYYDELKKEFEKVSLIDASTMAGQVLIKENNIKGLPTVIYNGKSISGNINPGLLKKLLEYDDDDENINIDSSVPSDF